MPAADLAAAFGVVFVAELGDKTQLAVALLSARGRPVPVVLGAWAAFLLLTALACTVGAALARVVPLKALRTAAGLLFLLLAALALRPEKEDEGDGKAGRASFVGAFAAIALAEMGDKTQLATATLAANADPWLVGAGAFLALAASAALAATVGAKLLARLPRRALRYGAAAAFAVAGLFLLAEAWL